MSVSRIRRTTLEPIRDATGRVVYLDVTMEYLDGKTEKTRRPMNPFEIAALDLWLLRQKGPPRR